MRLSYFNNMVEEGIQRLDKRASDQAEGKEKELNFVDVLLEVQSRNGTGFATGRDSIKAIILVKFNSSLCIYLCYFHMFSDCGI